MHFAWYTGNQLYNLQPLKGFQMHYSYMWFLFAILQNAALRAAFLRIHFHHLNVIIL